MRLGAGPAACAAVVLGALPALAGTPRSGAVRIRADWVDLAGIPPMASQFLFLEVASQLAPARVSLDWNRVAPGDETDAAGFRLVFLRSRGVGSDAGRSILGTTRWQGVAPTTWVYLPNVVTTVRLGQVRGSSPLDRQRCLGVALGRVVVHEVVHLLAPRIAHTPDGIMARRLSASALVRRRLELPPAIARALHRGAAAWAFREPPSNLAVGSLLAAEGGSEPPR